MPVHQVHRMRRWRFTPHGLDHLLPANRPTRLQAQHSQDHPLLERAEIDSGVATPGPKRTQDAEPQSRKAWVRHAASRSAEISQPG
jgi:hypothetical protein